MLGYAGVAVEEFLFATTLKLEVLENMAVCRLDKCKALIVATIFLKT
jgi:hypothetical protein